MKCPNCGGMIATPAMFQNVVVCTDCHAIATRLLQRAEQELINMKLLVLETLRVGLLEGRVQFGEGTLLNPPGKGEVLQEIVRQQAHAAARK